MRVIEGQIERVYFLNFPPVVQAYYRGILERGERMVDVAALDTVSLRDMFGATLITEIVER
jgi:hypothetical protein